MSEHKDFPVQSIDPDDIGHNSSNNPSFEQILEARMSRRGLLKGGFALMATSMFGMGLTACSDSNSPAATTATTSGLTLSFNAVAKSVADALTVPAGYTATVLLATGDPINTSVPRYRNDGTDTDFDNRSGDHHDGMHYFGMNVAGTAPDYSNSNRGLLCLNHEVAEDLGFMHANGPTDYGTANTNARPTAEIDKEVAAHGVSVVEVVKSGSTYQVNRYSNYNRRITGATVMDISGPAAYDDLMVTAYSTSGSQTRGTVNNCGNGYTPWGTYLTCEENWAGYFYRRNDAARTAKENTSLNRYGVSGSSSGRYNWSRPGVADTAEGVYARWNAGITGATAANDYRNVPNTFGWIVEIDPFDIGSTPRKRTALGRFGHEGAWPAKAVAGKPVVFYMGDDSRNEYIYKFVSDALWDAADANGGLFAGDKYMDAGKLYVAKFNADGTGTWELLSMSNPTVAAYATYTFADEADVVINARLAADAVGATKMDRPEWGAVNPLNGEVYMTLTNNSQRGGSVARPLDAANPRYYADAKGVTTNRGNVNGHIIRWKEAGNDHAATAFTWDIYLFGSEAAAAASVNLSSLTADNDFSSPDGLWFSHAAPGLLWVQTDDGAYTDQTNCMMLAAIPGSVGDGGSVSVANTENVPSNNNAPQTVVTRMGKTATTTTLRRFLVGPKDCEITGIAESPDGKAIFVNIQHPGENSTSVTDPNQFTSHWPDGGNARPRSATVVITRNDGGKIAV
ncbi:MAG TPA: PhoX family phosphatase [Candidatus Thiothrix moscowensis]|uniref:PhoX family protein n=1 Tax=unclassified Thiothrix TaxID=2636184 RepID=UPI0025E0CED5|nr:MULTISPECIES: PhoX family phosphatase [unclassified Thiothrix]HRJ52989.1 PhoX family phosphatase [Candidatus Thiothrix moscowensis]HRJ92967.1 PhoX family phosphatase [Candidatus Thiothrix moscowensis]